VTERKTYERRERRILVGGFRIGILDESLFVWWCRKHNQNGTCSASVFEILGMFISFFFSAFLC